MQQRASLESTSPPETPAEVREYRVRFSGSAGEYFRVWIVNVALTIVTLGIYSAWAKVRNKQYFYGSTELAAGSFQYTANPINILKGRLLVLGVLVAYNLAVPFQPVLAAALTVLIVALLPWVVVRAVGFNLRYSAYRGLRFGFDGGYWEAFRVYVLLTLLAVVSFGLAYPYVAWRRKRFLVERARYGRSGFGFDGEVGWFYVVYIVASLIFAGVMMGGTLLIAALAALAAVFGGAGLESGGLGETGKVVAIVVAALSYLGLLLSFIVLNSGIQAAIANHVWQRTRIADVRFDLQLNPARVVWIQASNIVAIVASAGLLIPWARVRMVRYKLSCFALLAPPGALEGFLAGVRETVSATGDELGEALDLDLGL